MNYEVRFLADKRSHNRELLNYINSYGTVYQPSMIKPTIPMPTGNIWFRKHNPRRLIDS